MKKLKRKLNFEVDTVEAFCNCSCHCTDNCTCYSSCGMVGDYRGNDRNNLTWDGRTSSYDNNHNMTYKQGR